MKSTITTAALAFALALAFTPAFADKCDGKEYNPQTHSCIIGMYLASNSEPLSFPDELIITGKGDGKINGFGREGNGGAECEASKLACCNFDEGGGGSYYSYDPKTTFCSGHPFIESPAFYKKCGGKEYDPSLQFCKDNKIMEFKCGGENYKLYEKFCVDDKLYKLCGEGNAMYMYNPKTQECDENYMVVAKAAKPAKPAAKGTVTVLSVDVASDNGARSKQEIMSVISARMPNIKNLYKKHLELKPDIRGNIKSKLIIAPSGDITSLSKVSSTTDNSEFDNEVGKMIATWKWKTIKSGNTTVTIPLKFD